jgi:hypothetical protein
MHKLIARPDDLLTTGEWQAYIQMINSAAVQQLKGFPKTLSCVNTRTNSLDK